MSLLWFVVISAVLSLFCHYCYFCNKTMSRLHTPISTVVHAKVVCAPKMLPIGIFLSHILRSKIIAPWNMCQYQNSPRISLETSVFYLNFRVHFFLAMWKKLGYRVNFLSIASSRSMYNTYPISTETPRLNLLS